MARLMLIVSYDGTEFAGSQIQPGVRTVQGEIERALAALGIEERRTIFAGRTDRGVHAAGQIVGCSDQRPDMSEQGLQSALNAVLPDDLAVRKVERRPNGFHPRYDARWREYRYLVWSGERVPLVRRAVWQRHAVLDLDLMQEAASRFVGTRDLASVAGGGDGVPWSEARERARGTIRTVFQCCCSGLRPWWGPETGLGRLYDLRVVADGFLPRMVRNMVWAIVDVGRGATPPAAIDELLGATDRRAGGATAPAHGLTLWQVGYTDWVDEQACRQPHRQVEC